MNQSEHCKLCHPELELILDMPTWTLPIARRVQDGLIASGEVLHCATERRKCIPLQLISREIAKMEKQAE